MFEITKAYIDGLRYSLFETEYDIPCNSAYSAELIKDDEDDRTD